MAARFTAYVVACIVTVTVVAGLLVGAQRDTSGPVDLAIVNGRVYTADGKGTIAEAVAVQGNKVLRVGTTRDIQRLTRRQTRIVDARGGTVLPGFIDGHTHFLGGSLALAQVNLLNAKTLAEIETTIRAWAEANAGRPWVIGRGWYYEPFPGGLPTRQILDAVVPDRPAYLTAYDGHTGWANSAALELAGVTRDTPDPRNGVVVKDRRGEPTGVLKEAAMSLVSRHLPQPTRDEQLAALRAGIAEARRFGVTSVQNASGNAEEFELYDELRRRGELGVRVYAAISAGANVTTADLDRFDALRAKYPDDPAFKTGMVKLVADGVIESHTAAMLAPYANRDEKGDPRFDVESLHRIVAELDRRGWQIMIHAIGDGAIRMALDALERASRSNPAPERGRRHRIEHIETTDPADIPRFGRLGVIASMQPYHGVPTPNQIVVWSGNIGPERASRGWAYNSIRKAGGRLAFGSDWPVVTINPLLGLHVAVHRTAPDGTPEGGWYPDERVPLEAALDAYTRDAAWASFDEHRKGSIEPDMLADLVVLSTDILARPDAIADASVQVTVFDGKIVYER
ncbi:MAG: amidohydrolase [Acidobacteriota bacterium]